jgi:hypothetical protein
MRDAAKNSAVRVLCRATQQCKARAVLNAEAQILRASVRGATPDGTLMSTTDGLGNASFAYYGRQAFSIRATLFLETRVVGRNANTVIEADRRLNSFGRAGIRIRR